MNKEQVIKKSLNVWIGGQSQISNAHKPLLLDMFDQIGSMFSIGPYYYYLVNSQKSQLIYVSNGIRNILGVEPKMFDADRLYSIMHPNDLDCLDKKIALTNHFYSNVISASDIPNYKTSYQLRLQNKQGNYRTILHQTKILGPTHTIDNAQLIHVNTDITYLGVRQNHRVSFIGDKRPNHHFDLIKSEYKVSNGLEYKFSKRELEVLKLISLGRKSEEIANQLFISVFTVNTHKRNVLKKSKCKNISHLIANCVREGII